MIITIIRMNLLILRLSRLKAILSELTWKKHTLEDIKLFVDNNFTTNMVSLSSTHLDIIGSYLNSQKLIYLESSHYTSKWLNMLMIPTITYFCWSFSY